MPCLPVSLALVARSLTRWSWRMIGWGFLASFVLAVPLWADDNGFWLSFPVPGFTPFTAPVSSAFDHSGGSRYSYEGTVHAYPGVVRTGTPAYQGCYSNGQQVVLAGLNYVGAQVAGGKSSLCYDGHPGWDYAFVTGTEIRAAAGGWVFDVSAGSEGSSGSGCSSAKPCNTVYVQHDQAVE